MLLLVVTEPHQGETTMTTACMSTREFASHRVPRVGKMIVVVQSRNPPSGRGRAPTCAPERPDSGPGKPKTWADALARRFVRAGASAGPSSERGTHNRGKCADQWISAGGSPNGAARHATQGRRRAPIRSEDVSRLT